MLNVVMILTLVAGVFGILVRFSYVVKDGDWSGSLMWLKMAIGNRTNIDVMNEPWIRGETSSPRKSKCV